MQSEELTQNMPILEDVVSITLHHQPLVLQNIDEYVYCHVD